MDGSQLTEHAVAVEVARPFSNEIFLWGYVKSLVYTSPIDNLDDLKIRIGSAFDQITIEMRHNAIMAYCDRLQRCLDIGGGHIEVTYA